MKTYGKQFTSFDKFFCFSINELKVFFLNCGYSSNHFFETISKPEFSRPCSHVIKNRDSTHPDPVPPLRVSLAPGPTSKTLHGFSIGNSPLDFRKRVHSDAVSFNIFI